MRFIFPLLLVLAFSPLSGCGSSGPKFVSVSGTVTYQGKPVPKASVSIMPEKGPIALAQTDDKGQFTAEPGVEVGKAKVLVSLVTMVGDPGKNDGSPAAALEFSKLVNSGKIRYVSGVPEKYGKAATTSLEITVTDDASKNNFPLDLTD